MSYEVRVWCEDGTLMGVAMVDSGTRTVDITDAVPDSGYAWGEVPWNGDESEAEAYAREWADGYAEWCRDTCECGFTDAAESDCGVMFEHGISIQYVRDGWTVREAD